MRKIILTGFFFVLLITSSFLSPESAHAQCVQKPLLRSCSDIGYPHDCIIAKGEWKIEYPYCCKTQGDCLLYQQTGGQPVTGPTLKPQGKCPKADQVETALGCISTDPSTFVAELLKWAIGIAGGIAFLLILYGGFQVLTSAGDPEKLTSGKDIVVSALAGLLMIVFSVLLLRIIGYDILQIPGFTK